MEEHSVTARPRHQSGSFCDDCVADDGWPEGFDQVTNFDCVCMQLQPNKPKLAPGTPCDDSLLGP